MTEFKSIFDLLKSFPDEQSCIDHLERLRWNGEPVSPFDPESKVYKCTGNRYKCSKTNKYFNVRTGTIFDNTKIPLLKWFMALYVFSSHKKGISSHQLSKDITITQKSTWFMLHRLRYGFEHPAFKEIVGSKEEKGGVEMDEAYFGGKIKNKHAKERREIQNKTSPSIKTAVFGMLERAGNLKAEVVKDVRRETILPIIAENVPKGSTIHTDSSHLYTPLDGVFDHNVIKHEQGEYVRGFSHTNSIEGFWSNLKRGIYGIYHHVSPEHLQKYVDEFTLRYNTRTFETSNRFDVILANVSGKKLTYKKLIKSDQEKGRT